jgi:hypothetical protein
MGDVDLRLLARKAATGDLEAERKLKVAYKRVAFGNSGCAKCGCGTDRLWCFICWLLIHRDCPEDKVVSGLAQILHRIW